MTHDDLKTALVSAIPAMPEPTDLAASARRRVRRSRARMAVTTGVATLALLVGVPMVVKQSQSPPTASPSPSLSAADCPVSKVDFPFELSGKPKSGPLVPVEGATLVKLCKETGTMQEPSFVLVRDVEGFLAELNELPAIGKLSGCHVVGYPQDSLVIQYQNGQTVVVYSERNCRGVWSGGQAREMGEILASFRQRYELQSIIPTESIKTPECAKTISQNRLREHQAQRDDLRVRRQGEELLPNPIALVVVCRYWTDGTEDLSLNRHYVTRSQLEEVRAMLNTPGKYNYCGQRDDPPVTLAHVLLVVDRTGAVVERRVIQKPCQAIEGTTVSAKINAWLS